MRNIASSTVTWKSDTESTLIHKSFELILMPDSRFKVYWNILMIISMLYSILSAPFQIAFLDSEIYALSIIELAIDILFFIDIIISCISGYYDDQSNFISDHKTIIKKYARTWMIFDILACFPLQYIIESQKKYNSLLRVTRMQRLYRLIKMAKILRLIKIFKSNDQRKNIHLVLKVSIELERLIWFLILIIFLIHIIACFWVYIGKLYSDSSQNWLNKFQFLDYSSLDLYVVALYWSITTLATVGYGDIAAVNDAEKTYCTIVMIIGIILYSYTVSSISNIISALDSRRAIFNKKADLLSHITIKYKLNTAFHTKLLSALEYEHRNNDKELDEIVADLPLPIKQKLLNKIFEEKISRNSFFMRKTIGFKAWVASKLKPLKINKKDFIYKENEFATDMYFIVKGDACLMVKRELYFYPAIVYSDNYYFGEIDLLFSSNKTHLHTVFSERGCELLTLSREHFQWLLQEFEDESIEICTKAMERLERIKIQLADAANEVESKFKITAVQSIPLSKGVNVREIKFNARKSVEMNSIVRSTSMYKNIVDFKYPETSLIGLKRKLKTINVYAENVISLSNELLELVISKKDH